MAFAKHETSPFGAEPTWGPSAAPPRPASPPAIERYEALRQLMLQTLRRSIEIADAIRSNGTISMQGFGGVTDPETAPIRIQGVGEHFVVVEDGMTLHAMYTYVSADQLDRINPAAQFQLHDLFERVRAINLYCQDAERNEALAVALQTPSMPQKIDRIIARSSFFAGYFENFAAVGPISVGLPGKARPDIDFGQIKTTIERHKLMALDKMIEPGRYDEHAPAVEWPFLGAELLRRPETGQQILQGVYFPALYARQMAAKAKAKAKAEAEAAARENAGDAVTTATARA